MLAFQVLLLALSALPLSLTEPLMPIQIVTTFATSTTSTTATPTCPTATITTQPAVGFKCLEERIICAEPDKRCFLESTTTIPCDCPATMPTVTVASPPCGACDFGCQTGWTTVTATC